MDAAKREELLRLLADHIAPGSRLEEDETHRRAEELLLDAIGDKELTAAWFSARKNWWYA